ncbi:hypothetical protein D3C78_1294810 [compost metagenome]
MERADLLELRLLEEVVLVVEVEDRLDRIATQLDELGDGLLDGLAGGHAHLLRGHRHQLDLLAGELARGGHLGQRRRGAALGDAIQGVHLLRQAGEVAGGHPRVAAGKDQRFVEAHGLLAALEVGQAKPCQRRHPDRNGHRQRIERADHRPRGVTDPAK